MLSLIAAALLLLKEFPLGIEKLTTEASSRASLHVELWQTVRFDLTSKYTAVDKLRSFADVNRRLIWSKAT